MKPRNLVYPILHVEGLHPLVNPGHLINPVDIGGGGGPVVLEPHKLGRREQGGDSKRITFTWMEVVLVGHVILEPLNVHGDKVVKTRSKQDSHGPADPRPLQATSRSSTLAPGMVTQSTCELSGGQITPGSLGWWKLWRGLSERQISSP